MVSTSVPPSHAPRMAAGYRRPASPAPGYPGWAVEGRQRWRGHPADMLWFAYTLIALLVLTSVLLTLLILLHRGKGGGLSSMFGGGVSSSLTGSSVAEKNLDRYTLVVGMVWFACIVGFGLWIKFTANNAGTTPTQ